MKIVSYLNAITTSNVNWEEVRPLAGAPFPVTIQIVKERYQFQVAGQSLSGQQVGLMMPSFQAGQLRTEEGFIVVNQFEFQPNAIVISSATTEQTYKFADDLFAFLHTELGFRTPPRLRKMTHLTTIIADFGPTLENVFGKWKDIASLPAMKDGAELLPLGIRFMGYRDNQPVIERQFVFERRLAAPPGENWSFSQAPLDTDSHVKLLNEIERIF